MISLVLAIVLLFEINLPAYAENSGTVVNVTAEDPLTADYVLPPWPDDPVTEKNTPNRLFFRTGRSVSIITVSYC